MPAEIPVSGFIAFRFTQANIEKFYGLMWSDVAYVKPTNDHHFQWKHEDEPIIEWMKIATNLENEGELEVQDTIYCNGGGVEYQLKEHASGEKLILVNISPLLFKIIPDPPWLGDPTLFVIGATTQWSQRRSDKMAVVLTILKGNRAEMRLLYSPDFKGKDDYPEIFKDGITEMFNKADNDKVAFVRVGGTGEFILINTWD